jgi:hypothetical protein
MIAHRAHPRLCRRERVLSSTLSVLAFIAFSRRSRNNHSLVFLTHAGQMPCPSSVIHHPSCTRPLTFRTMALVPHLVQVHIMDGPVSDRMSVFGVGESCPLRPRQSEPGNGARGSRRGSEPLMMRVERARSSHLTATTACRSREIRGPFGPETGCLPKDPSGTISGYADLFELDLRVRTAGRPRDVIWRPTPLPRPSGVCDQRPEERCPARSGKCTRMDTDPQNGQP